MEKIENTISELGGLELTASFFIKKDASFSVETYLTAHKLDLPAVYIEFSKKYGFHQFNTNVVFDSMHPIPSAYEDGACPIDFFYGWGKGTESLPKIRKTYLEQIQPEYFVFAEGIPGDQLVIHTLNNKIYYWAHEEPVNNCLFLVADSFEKFIIGLRIKNDDDDDDDGNDVVSAWFADDF